MVGENCDDWQYISIVFGTGVYDYTTIEHDNDELFVDNPGEHEKCILTNRATGVKFKCKTLDDLRKEINRDPYVYFSKGDN